MWAVAWAVALTAALPRAHEFFLQAVPCGRLWCLHSESMSCWQSDHGHRAQESRHACHHEVDRPEEDTVPCLRNYHSLGQVAVGIEERFPVEDDRHGMCKVLVVVGSHATEVALLEVDMNVDCSLNDRKLVGQEVRSRSFDCIRCHGNTWWGRYLLY